MTTRPSSAPPPPDLAIDAAHSSSIYTYATMALLAACLAFLVVILGAYTRLTDAGLGCPDWPGCYGQLVVPQSHEALARAQMHFPGQLVEPSKAWAEMTHRYIAGSLGLLILFLALWATYRRQRGQQPLIIPWILVGLVCFQALLGKWTVTLLLLPLVVMGHLLGGMTILACLWWLGLRCLLRPDVKETTRTTEIFYRKVLPWAILSLAIVFVQIALGGWTGANYAALACPDFPYCQGKWLPTWDFSAAMNFFHPVGINYEGGVLNSVARMTINTLHRLGAVVTGLAIFILGVTCISQRHSSRLHGLGLLLMVILITQMTLGIMNITHLLPLPVAVLHNAFGALLLISTLTVCYELSRTLRRDYHAKQAQPDTLYPAHNVYTVATAAASDTTSATLDITNAATWRDYVELTKPRVVALMLLTALVGMQLASADFVGYRIILAGLFGIACAAAAAAAINHSVDRMIDSKMTRTKSRPVVIGKIQPQHAFIFAGILTVISMITLCVFVNVLTAVLTFCTLIGYAFVYTSLLKPLTSQNIVIGGLAGSMPPLLGWTAVSNHVDALPLLLVLIIFTWTPPHFWALAIHRHKEYEHAGIPMLPVTHGIAYTKTSILLYTMLLTVMTLLPYLTQQLGVLYGIGALILNAVFIALAIQLKWFEKPLRAIRLFHFSNIYLLLLFALMLGDHLS